LVYVTNVMRLVVFVLSNVCITDIVSLIYEKIWYTAQSVELRTRKTL
jgi:hypothetical protein